MSRDGEHDLVQEHIRVLSLSGILDMLKSPSGVPVGDFGEYQTNAITLEFGSIMATSSPWATIRYQWFPLVEFLN